MSVFEKRSPIEKYAYYMQQANLDVPPLLWLGGSVIAAIALGLLVFVGTLILRINEPLHSILAFTIVLDVMIGYPYMKGRSRIDAIEEALPDALKQISDTLKTGSTYEYALREVASAQYGPLSDEMKKVLRKLEEGENFENSLLSLTRNVDSRLVGRVITIIVDTVRAGAQLAEILDDISQDVREMNRIAAERRSKTILQVIFMVAAGVLVAPFIFGLVSVVIDFLIRTSGNTGAITGANLVAVRGARDLIIFAIKGYIFIISVAAAVMIGAMRDGKLSKSLLYTPLLLMLAYTVFFLSQILVGSIVGAGI